jgi:hypothetical protein
MAMASSQPQAAAESPRSRAPAPAPTAVRDAVGARAHDGRQEHRGQAVHHAVGDEDVARVGERGGEAQARAERVHVADAAAGEHEDEAGEDREQHADPAGGQGLPAQGGGAQRHPRGIGVEHERQQRRVHALERGEEQAGLRRVADGPEAERGGDEAAARARPERPAGGGQDEGEGPEQDRGEREADHEQGHDARALLVGELAEDRQGPERGGGDEAGQDAHGRMVLPATAKLQRRFVDDTR